ncbi:hypothetical protein EK21DRAFT_75819 [Setomelanomma holmii]|uniref:Uncharacterized protein n=1 Tax=Setomelanomma holmii TaxID=210430 RepID=A0A9P4H1Q8_9PLEO|nr:hypothetical protein EK21DRAFT_75819 [Setomelanomma holmii]
MSSHRSLQEALQAPVTAQARLEILDRLWPYHASAIEEEDKSDWDAYFAYYTRQCTMALLDEGRQLCARNHEDILRIARLLTTEPTRSSVKTRIQEGLTQRRADEEEMQMLEGSASLATRLLAMIDVGPLPSEVSGRRTLPWCDESLYAAIHTHFDTPQDPDAEKIALAMDFTARNIVNTAGIAIIWTDNLVDHLRLVDNDKKLCVFHHVSFLNRMEWTQSHAFPAGFARETLDTLRLLFPSSDRKAKRWLRVTYRSDVVSAKVDGGLLNVGELKINHSSRRLENLNFWRDRLGAVKDAVDEATPPTRALLKALSDHKQSDRWLSSWVAIVAIGLTLFFGLVQSIEGAIQVYKAYHSESN